MAIGRSARSRGGPIATVTFPSPQGAHTSDPAASRHRRIRFNEADRQKVLMKNANSVAAHLGDAAVGVAVVHEERRVGGDVLGLGVVLAAHDPQYAVGADAGVPVAQRPATAAGAERRPAPSRSGSRRKSFSVPCPLMNRTGPAYGGPAPIRSAPAASSHRTRGSRRNQERWRRTNRRVPRTVCSIGVVEVAGDRPVVVEHAPAAGRTRAPCRRSGWSRRPERQQRRGPRRAGPLHHPVHPQLDPLVQSASRSSPICDRS